MTSDIIPLQATYGAWLGFALLGQVRPVVIAPGQALPRGAVLGCVAGRDPAIPEGAPLTLKDPRFFDLYVAVSLARADGGAVASAVLAHPIETTDKPAWAMAVVDSDTVACLRWPADLDAEAIAAGVAQLAARGIRAAPDVALAGIIDAQPVA